MFKTTNAADGKGFGNGMFSASDAREAMRSFDQKMGGDKGTSAAEGARAPLPTAAVLHSVAMVKKAAIGALLEQACTIAATACETVGVNGAATCTTGLATAALLLSKSTDSADDQAKVAAIVGGKTPEDIVDALAGSEIYNPDHGCFGTCIVVCVDVKPAYTELVKTLLGPVEFATKFNKPALDALVYEKTNGIIKTAFDSPLDSDSNVDIVMAVVNVFDAVWLHERRVLPRHMFCGNVGKGVHFHKLETTIDNDLFKGGAVRYDLPNSSVGVYGFFMQPKTGDDFNVYAAVRLLINPGFVGVRHFEIPEFVIETATDLKKDFVGEMNMPCVGDGTVLAVFDKKVSLTVDHRGTRAVSVATVVGATRGGPPVDRTPTVRMDKCFWFVVARLDEVHGVVPMFAAQVGK